MATNASYEISHEIQGLPNSVLRPQGSDPSSSPKPSVHLRNSQRSRTTAGLLHNKPPLPPGPTSVYSRGSVNRVVGRAKSNSAPNGTLSASIKSSELLPVIEEDQRASLVRHSRQSVTSDGFKWLDDDNSTVFKDDGNSKALEKCQNSILKPYYAILKLIGWKQLFQYDEIHDHCIKKVANAMFAILVVITLIIGSVFQEVLCFRRSNAFSEEVKTTNGSFIYLRCDGGFIRIKAIGSILVLVSYILGFYIFRYSQREHLSTLTEKVFLGYTDQFGQFSQKKLIRYLQLLGLIGVVWFMLSIPLNILRVYSLQLLSRDTYYYYLSDYSERELLDLYNRNMRPPSELGVQLYVYVIITMISDVVSDLFYIAAIVNYALQCQLITYLINVTVERVCRNRWIVDDAIKEIKVTQDFLKVLNGQVASQMSVLLFVLIQTFINATRSWLKTDTDNVVPFINGLLNTTSWLFLALFIIVQATVVTITCQKIRRLGMNLRTRPFTYLETSQLDLDSLVLYTTSITVDARLVHIPMKPAYVFPVLFAIATVCSILPVPF